MHNYIQQIYGDSTIGRAVAAQNNARQLQAYGMNIINKHKEEVKMTEGTVTLTIQEYEQLKKGAEAFVKTTKNSIYGTYDNLWIKEKPEAKKKIADTFAKVCEERTRAVEELEQNKKYIEEIDRLSDIIHTQLLAGHERIDYLIDKTRATGYTISRPMTATQKRMYENMLSSASLTDPWKDYKAYIDEIEENNRKGGVVCFLEGLFGRYQ